MAANVKISISTAAGASMMYLGYLPLRCYDVARRQDTSCRSGSFMLTSKSSARAANDQEWSIGSVG
eukprot:scaffold87407_cov45-Attheya_sp.AAC.1